MDPKDVARLHSLREDLRSQIKFAPISTQLLQSELINHEEYQRILSRVTESEQVDVLLDVLTKKGSDSLSRFITVLETDYPWLAKAIKNEPVMGTFNRKETVLDSNETPQISKLNQVVTAEMMRMIRHNHRVVRSWTTLAHALDLTRQLHNIRVRVSLFNEDSDMCVLYLLQEWVGQRPQEATLHKLLLVLREEGFNDVADELEAKFA